MSKYKELCESFKKTRGAFFQSRMDFEQSFTQKLSNYLDCETDRVRLSIQKPKHSKPNKFEWSYSYYLEILLENENDKNIIRIEQPLSVLVFSDKLGEYSFSVEYNNKIYSLNSEEEMNDFFSIIFKEFQDNFIPYE